MSSVAPIAYGVAAVCGALGLVLAVLAARYILHVFQQSTYRASEYGRWLSANWNKTASLFVSAVLGIAAVATVPAVPAVGIVLCVLAAAFTLFTIYNFNFLRSYMHKKPLVYTARVKRLVAVDAVLCVLACVVGFLLGGAAGLAVACCLLAPLQVALVPLCNAVNAPVERSVNNRYINEARAILADCPDLVVVGITGSYGKTSTKHFLFELLRSSHEVLMTPGNYNTTLGVVRTVRELLRPTHEVFLCEMGARHVGDIAEICDLVHPSYGIITALGPQHLETFGSIEAVSSTKFELADAVRKGGRLFLNTDNDLIREKASAEPAFVSYGMGEGSDYRIEDVDVSAAGMKFTVRTADGSCSYSTKLLGAHNVADLAGAIAVAHELGVPLEDMRVPVRRLRPVEHRLSIARRGATTILDDAYNSNPEGSAAALEVLGMLEGTKILVTPGMVELGPEQDALNAQFAARAASVCDDVVIVGSHNQKALLEGLREAGFPQARTHCRATVEAALQCAESINAGQVKTILIENDLPDMY